MQIFTKCRRSIETKFSFHFNFFFPEWSWVLVNKFGVRVISFGARCRGLIEPWRHWIRRKGYARPRHMMVGDFNLLINVIYWSFILQNLQDGMPGTISFYFREPAFFRYLFWKSVDTYELILINFHSFGFSPFFRYIIYWSNNMEGMSSKQFSVHWYINWGKKKKSIFSSLEQDSRSILSILL